MAEGSGKKMPTYEFTCKSCGNRFTVFTSVAKRSEVSCPSCQSKDLQQVYNALVFVKSSAGSGVSSSGASGGCSRGSCSGCSGC
ncbi:MAG: FmdB family zinc ribbon protein [Thermacetogeniaceae bacterium]